VSGGQDSHVQGFRLSRPKTLAFALLQKTQQLALTRQGKLRNFIQEQRPALRLMDESGRIPVGTGKSPFQ